MLALQLSKSVFFRTSVLKRRCINALPTLFSEKYPFLIYDNRCSSARNERVSQVSKTPAENVLNKFNKTSKKNVQIIERENIWTIPNILCCTRIACSPYLGVLIYSGHFNLAFYVMICVGLTDILDGFIARTFTSQSSKFGTFLDPLADKILITTTCISLTYVNLIPLPLTVLILSRDVALIAAGFYIRYKSLPPPKTFTRYFDATHATTKLEPTGISKFNSLVQLGTIGIGLLSPVVGFIDHPLLQYLWYFTASTTIASAVSYIYEMDKYRYDFDKKEDTKSEKCKS